MPGGHWEGPGGIEVACGGLRGTRGASKTYPTIAPRKHLEHPKSLLGGTRSLQNQRKIVNRHVQAPKGLPECINRLHGRLPEKAKARLLTIVGVRPESQNRPKMGPRAKKSIQRRCRKRFLLVFLGVAVWSRSPDQF